MSDEKIAEIRETLEQISTSLASPTLTYKEIATEDAPQLLATLEAVVDALDEYRAPERRYEDPHGHILAGMERQEHRVLKVIANRLAVLPGGLPKPWPVKVGEKLTTAEQILQLPQDTVLRGEDENIYEVGFYAEMVLHGPRNTYTPEEAVSGALSDNPIVPVTVLYIPAQEADQ